MKTSLAVKRVYDPPAAADGRRILVDRLWPRGLKKESLKLEAWMRELGPSTALRQWFGHDPARWKEFQRRYASELDGKPELWTELLHLARQGRVTLLVSARDAEHSNGTALKLYLEKKKSAA